MIITVLFWQGFDQPHDLTISPDGESVFVGETGPNVVWKFIKEHEWPEPLALTAATSCRIWFRL